MKLDAAQTAIALAVAVSFASGVKSNFGTMMKPLHVGHCARNGLFAARLAREGYTANTASAFEHKQGFFEVFNGAGTYDAAKILPAWGNPWDIVREHDLKPADVEKIESWTHTRRLEHTNRPNPQSELDAKFSVQYCLARALVDRKVAIDQFEGDAYKDARTREVTSRVHAAAYTTAQFPAENHFGAEVKVTLKNGAVHTHKVNQPYGRTSKNPLTRELLKEKFVNCAVRALPADAVDKLYTAIDGFEKIGNVTEISGLTAPHQKSAARTAMAATA
jgi:2-methylcitrate dehydratase PrpD